MKRIIVYVLAFLVGLFPGFFLVFNSIFSDPSGKASERVITFVLIAVVYGILGFVFGYLKPSASWRLGLVLTLPAIIFVLIYSFREVSTIALGTGYIILTLVFACYSARIASRIAQNRSNQ